MSALWHIESLPERQKRDSWEIEEVLVEFEEPILAIWKKKGERQRHLGINAQTDWSSKTTRWIYARMTPAQWEGLVRGLIPVANIFTLQKSVVVIDRVAVTGVPQKAWTVQPKAIPTECLPVPGALLPEDVREVFIPTLKAVRAASGISVFRFFGHLINGLHTRLDVVGKAEVLVQKYWADLTKSVLGAVPDTLTSIDSRAALEYAGIGKASLGIKVRPHDPESFDIVSKQCANAIASLYGLPGVDAETVSPLVLSASAGLLHDLNELKVEMIAEMGPRSAFVSYGLSNQWKKVEKAAEQGLFGPMATGLKEEELDGVFVTVSSRERGRHNFEFRCTNGRTIKGQIDSAIVRKISKGELDLTVSRRVGYRATFSMVGEKAKMIAVKHVPELFGKKTRKKTDRKKKPEKR